MEAMDREGDQPERQVDDTTHPRTIKVYPKCSMDVPPKYPPGTEVTGQVVHLDNNRCMIEIQIKVPNQKVIRLPIYTNLVRKQRVIKHRQSG